ncbi:MAG TPA: hypothetical protein VK970_20680 [Candidatus Methylacidiphilales bacterium]|nr:hypothetical protein [Candidatus Methylacidiphilales bacterium]
MKRIPFTTQTFFPSDIQAYLEYAGDTEAGAESDASAASSTSYAHPAAEAHQSALLAEPVAQLRANLAILADTAISAAMEAAALARANAGNTRNLSPEESGPLPEAEEVRQLLEFIAQAVEAGPLHIAAFSSEARIWISTHICTNAATLGAWQRVLAELCKSAPTTLDARACPLFLQRLKEARHILALSRASLEMEKCIGTIAAGAAAMFIRLHDENLKPEDAPPAVESAESAESEEPREPEPYPTVTEADVRSLSELFLQQFVQIIALGSDAEIRLNFSRSVTEIFASQLEGTPQEWHYLLGALQFHIEDAIGAAAAAPLPPYFELLSKARYRLNYTGAVTRLIDAEAETLEKQITELFPAESDTSLAWRDILSFALSEVLLDDSASAPACLPWLVLQNSTLLYGISSDKFEAFAEIVLSALNGVTATAGTEAQQGEGAARLQKALSRSATALGFVEEEASQGTARVQAVVAGAATHLRQGLGIFDGVADLEQDLAYALHMAQRVAVLHGSECAARTAFRQWFLLLHTPAGHWRHARTIVSALQTQIRQDWAHRKYWQQHPAAGASGAACKLLEDLPATVAAAELSASAQAQLDAASGSTPAALAQKAALALYPFSFTPRAAALHALAELYPLPSTRPAQLSAKTAPASATVKDDALEIPAALKESAKDPAFSSFCGILAESAPAAALQAAVWSRSDEIAKKVTAQLTQNFAELRTDDHAADALRRDVARLLRRLAQSLGPDVESRAEFLSSEWSALVEPHLSPRPHSIFRTLYTLLSDALHLHYGAQAVRLTEPLLRPLLCALRTDSAPGEIEPTPFTPLRVTFPLFEELRRHPLPGWTATNGSPFPDITEFYRQNSAAALAFAVQHESEEHRAGSVSFLEANFPFLATVLPRGIAHFEWAGFLSMEITKAWFDLAAVTPPGNVLDRFLAGLILGTGSLPAVTDRLRLVAYLQAYRDFHRQSFAAAELLPKTEELANLAISHLDDPAIDTDYLRPAIASYLRGVVEIFGRTAGIVARLEARRLTLEKLLPQSKFPRLLLAPLAAALHSRLEQLSLSEGTRSEATLWFADLRDAATSLAPLQPAVRKIFASHHAAGTQPVFSPRPVEETAWQQILSAILALDSIRDEASAPTLQLVTAASIPLPGELNLKELPGQLQQLQPRVQEWLDEPASPALAPLFESFQRALATFTEWKKITTALPETVTTLRDKKTALGQLPEGSAGSHHIANLLLLLIRNAALPPGEGRASTWAIPLQQPLLSGETAGLLSRLSTEELAQLQHVIGKAVCTPAAEQLPALRDSLAKSDKVRATWDQAWGHSPEDLRLFALRYIVSGKS